jgi:hypothetical protein
VIILAARRRNSLSSHPARDRDKPEKASPIPNLRFRTPAPCPGRFPYIRVIFRARSRSMRIPVPSRMLNPVVLPPNSLRIYCLR